TLADLGEISAGIAHEFRNSLSTILGYLKLAGREQLPDETQKRLRHAEEEAELLSEAVEGLLSFARPMQMEFRETDLATLVRGILERFEDQHDGMDIVAQLEDSSIDADPILLSRAMENVIRNAIDAVRQKGGGRITITLRSDPGPVLTISDTGVGFEPEAAARLMLPFQSDKPDGMGLGLPLARKIVMLHGGSLQLTGKPGEGATVVIEFPAG
ncbi:MAG TPA: ATP-binding protein, partial [Thermoanaerobaculia bacterium]|nr:ATP-binding protein [Thermoanaerobaculia bacterium]